MWRRWLILAVLLTCARPAQGAITLHVHNHTDNGVTSSATCVVALTGVSSGDLITVEWTISDGGGDTFSSVSGSLNGTYASAITIKHDTNIGQFAGIHFVANSASGNETITVTGTVSAQFKACSAQAWSGAATSSPQDSGMTQQQTLTATANPTTGGNLTPAGNGEVVIASLLTANNTPTAGANYALTDVNAATFLWPEFWIQTTAAATNGPYTLSSDSWTDQMVAFKSSGGGGTVRPPSQMTMGCCALAYSPDVDERKKII
jgi:hypothetical protein